MDDKKKNLLLIGGIVGVVIVIIIIVLSSLSGGPTRKLNYKELEQKIKEVGEEYYKENESLLPKNDGDTRQISVDDLVKLELMKPIDELIDNDSKCTGKLTVKRENGKYYYVPFIDCGKDYVTSELYKKIIDDNPVVTEGSGLYQQNNEYVFRGEELNNYVKFANKTWRIVKVDEENDIKLILDNVLDSSTSWDDRYNSERNASMGINNFSVSRIKSNLKKLYNSDELFNEDDKKYIVSKSVCVDAIAEEDKITTNCSKYEENVNVSLLDVREYLNASIDSSCLNIKDSQCQNYNYLNELEDSESWWTINANKENSYEVFYVESYGSTDLKTCISSAYIRPVVYVTKDIMFSEGNGSKDKPYTIE